MKERLRGRGVETGFEEEDEEESEGEEVGGEEGEEQEDGESSANMHRDHLKANACCDLGIDDMFEVPGGAMQVVH